jgi:phospholipid/cholesterol/gamma-HCH transport system permease protein
MALHFLSLAQASLLHLGRRARARWASWLRVLLLAAQIIVLALASSSYRSGRQRQTILRHIYLATAPLLTWFLVLSALISLVLIRIVVATAVSYGLSQYALEVVVRTLVLELIPLYAAMSSQCATVCPMRTGFASVSLAGGRRYSPLRAELLQAVLLPCALAAAFSVLLLAALSCVVALVLSYLTVYGFSPWGLSAYTHSVGKVFSAPVTLIFSLKTLFFSLAVAIVPMAATAQRDSDGRYSRGSDITELAPAVFGGSAGRSRVPARQLLLIDFA